MVKEIITKITGAYATDIYIKLNTTLIDEVGGVPVVKYRNCVTITFELKGENILSPREVREYFSESSVTMFTALETTEWAATNILNFIYAGKNDIAGYVPQQ